jgi:predicted RNase H-like HicB family nuclease
MAGILVLSPASTGLVAREYCGGIRYSKSMELIFEVRDAEEGGYYARALGHGIFTQAETWDELRANVLEVVGLHFEDEPVQPRLVQLQLL